MQNRNNPSTRRRATGSCIRYITYLQLRSRLRAYTILAERASRFNRHDDVERMNAITTQYILEEFNLPIFLDWGGIISEMEAFRALQAQIDLCKHRSAILEQMYCFDVHTDFHNYRGYDGIRMIGELTLTENNWPLAPRPRNYYEPSFNQVSYGKRLMNEARRLISFYSSNDHPHNRRYYQEGQEDPIDDGSVDSEDTSDEDYVED